MAFLKLPQVKVQWGDLDLTNYPIAGKYSEPVVYDVQVNLEGGNSWPTGSMKWNPSGPGFDLYEKLVSSKEKQDEVITVTYYYPGGPRISFSFEYGGTDISYGNQMDITVLLYCKSSAKAAATRNSLSNNKTEKDKDKGVDALTMSKEVNNAYKNAPNMVWTECAEKDAKEVRIKNVNIKDQTNGAFNQGMQQQLGNKIFLSNIGSTGESIAFPPFTWETKKGCGDVLMPEKTPKPNKRYGYLLGPGIITTISRKMEYRAPTQDASGVATQPKNPPQGTTSGRTSNTANTSLTRTQKEAQKEEKKSVQNTSSPSNVKGVQYSENKNGPQKQQAMNEEEGVKLTAQLFLCPAVMGIKPEDIIYIPSLKQGDKLIEDYKVTSVAYAQDGATFSVSIQACRSYGLNKPMNEKAAQKFIEKADSLKTLDDWAAYAWSLERGSSPGVATA